MSAVTIQTTETKYLDKAWHGRCLGSVRFRGADWVAQLAQRRQVARRTTAGAPWTRRIYFIDGQRVRRLRIVVLIAGHLG